MQCSVLLDSQASETIREVSYSCMTELLFPCAVRRNRCNIGGGEEGEEAGIKLPWYINLVISFYILSVFKIILYFLLVLLHTLRDTYNNCFSFLCHLLVSLKAL